MRIAVVGAGKGGTNLIKTMHNVGEMEVAVVIDRSTTSPGIELAKSMGISTATMLSDIKTFRVDAIIEATGVPAVASELEELYGQSKAIISSEVAKVIMTIVDNSVMVADQLGSQMQLIAKTSAVFQHEFGGLRSSIVDLDQVSEVLLKAVQQSSQYIAQSDNLSKSVHAIASQTKILGINANIEAARAGEAGKGFSVVASEVQKLSDTSTKFAIEISDLLKALAIEINEIQNRIDVLKTVSNTQTATSYLVEGALQELNHIVK